MSSSTDNQQREVDRQVAAMLARSASYQAMPPDERVAIQKNTTAIVTTTLEQAFAFDLCIDQTAVGFIFK